MVSTTLTALGVRIEETYKSQVINQSLTTPTPIKRNSQLIVPFFTSTQGKMIVYYTIREAARGLVRCERC